MTETKTKKQTLPVLFIGHGSPTNAIEDNEFNQYWKHLGKTIPRPKAILCISAHWYTKGTFVTAMETPRTIYDFWGFDKKLYEMKYPAKGSPALAKRVAKLIGATLDMEWGLDHGTWIVLQSMYPKADIPVIQLSLDTEKSPTDHYTLAKKLAKLRTEGVLIIGSGNIVHNLGLIGLNTAPYKWAQECDEKIKSAIQRNEYQKLLDYRLFGHIAKLAVPNPDHFLPLLYTVALRGKKDEVSFFCEKIVYGSISMRGVLISGKA